MQVLTRQSKIAIAGAGIGGLALAVSLKQKGWKHVTVFYKDLFEEQRRQGYGLTILQGKRVLK